MKKVILEGYEYNLDSRGKSKGYFSVIKGSKIPEGLKGVKKTEEFEIEVK